MKKLLLLGIVALVVFLGCNFVARDFYLDEGDLYDPTKGQLVLVINGGSIPNSKTISPNMDIATYELHFHNSTTGEDFTPVISAAESFVYSESGFTPSDPIGTLDWSVAITAKNNEAPTPEIIGAIDGTVGNTHTFTVAAGETTTIAVNVIPLLSTEGRLRVYVSWPDAAGSDETLTATLTPDPTSVGTFQDGYVISPNIVPPGDNIRTAEYDSNVGGELLPVGYYMLNLKLEDGSTFLWGWMEAVRIVGFLDTDTLNTKFALQLSDAGSVYFDGPSHTNMQNPVKITSWDTVPATPPDPIGPGDLVTVTANLEYPVPKSTSYTYEWYIDGENQTDPPVTLGGSETSVSFIINGDDPYSSGEHNLGILITGRTAEYPNGDIETLSSENYEFTIQ